MANPTAIAERNSMLMCVAITIPSAAPISAITIATFHPCGRKKRSMDSTWVPSSGARNGKFTIITSIAAISAVAAPMA